MRSFSNGGFQDCQIWNSLNSTYNILYVIMKIRRDYLDHADLEWFNREFTKLCRDVKSALLRNWKEERYYLMIPENRLFNLHALFSIFEVKMWVEQ